MIARLGIVACVAGMTVAEVKPSWKIVGGQKAELADFAFVAALIYCQDPVNLRSCWQRCSGSLIAPNVVITAAHCVRDWLVEWESTATNLPAENLKVLLGSTSWKSLDDTAKIVSVKSIKYNSYGINIRFPYDGDMALLELDECVSESPGVIEYAHVATWESEPDRSSGCSDVYAAGFGMVSNVPEAIYQDDGKLRFIRDNLQSADVCRAAYTTLSEGVDTPDYDNTDSSVSGAVLAENYICTGGATVHSVCSGDSGGPIFTRLDNGKAQIIGLTSFGFGVSPEGYIYCTIGPDFATRVAFYADWIQSELETSFASCPEHDIANTFASNPLEPYPQESLSDLWKETRCNAFPFPESTNWQCGNGECIDSSLVCDTNSNCSDDSDEQYQSEDVGLCQGPLSRRLFEVSTVSRNRKPIIERIVLPNLEERNRKVEVRSTMTCEDATSAVLEAIDRASQQYTIGDIHFDPSDSRDVCDHFSQCVGDDSSSDYEYASVYCTQLNFFIEMTDASRQYAESFGSRFGASCSDDEYFDTLTDAAPITDSSNHSSNEKISAVLGIGLAIIAMV